MANIPANPVTGYKQKEARFHFYMHQRWRGAGWNQIVTVDPRRPYTFGQSSVYEYPMTDGPDPSSTVMAHARGLVTGVGITGGSVQAMNSLTITFEDPRFKGSTLELHGMAVSPFREIEWAVIAGTGLFRLAQGVLKADLYQEDNSGRSFDVNIHVLYYPTFTV